MNGIVDKSYLKDLEAIKNNKKEPNKHNLCRE